MRPTTIRDLLVFAVLAPMALVLFAPTASACPFCDGGPTGVNEVREGVFDTNFWPKVAATLAPFPVLAGIVALIYFGPPSFGGRRADAADVTGPAASEPH